MKKIGLVTYTGDEIPVWDFTKRLTRVLHSETLYSDKQISELRLPRPEKNKHGVYELGNKIWAVIEPIRTDDMPETTLIISPYVMYVDPNIPDSLNGDVFPWLNKLYVYHPDNSRTQINATWRGKVHFGDF